MTSETNKFSPEVLLRRDYRRARSGICPEAKGSAGIRRELGVYGVRKIWRQLTREGPRCFPLHVARDASRGFAGIEGFPLTSAFGRTK
jgi:hypothetical protein